MIKLKDILMETSVWAPGTGSGTKDRTFRPKRTMRGGNFSDLDPSGLTPEEIKLIMNLPRKERKAWFEKRRKQFRMSKGLCDKCGKNPVINYPDGTISRKCTACLKVINDKSNQINKERKEKGLCFCGQPLAIKTDGTKSSYCQYHTEKRQQRNIERIKNGQCIDCGKEAAVGKDGKKLIHCRRCIDVYIRNKKSIPPPQITTELTSKKDVLQIPPQLYHGTIESRANRIWKYGLEPAKVRNYHWSEKGVYLTTDPDIAKEFADAGNHTPETGNPTPENKEGQISTYQSIYNRFGMNEDLIIITVNTKGLDPKKFKPDPSYIKSFIYLGTIPAKNIVDWTKVE